MAGAGWREFRRGESCPICGSEGWCGRSEFDPAVVSCMRLGDSAPPAGWTVVKQGEQGARVCRQVGLAAAAPDPRRAKERKSSEKKRRAESIRRAREVWNAAGPLTDRALAYLAGRGLKLDPAATPDCLRFLPDCEYRPTPDAVDAGFPEGRLPAIIVGLTDRRARHLTAVQRIYLDPDHASRRWRAPDAKKMLGAASGSAARLGPSSIDIAGAPLVLAEGLETALAVWLALGRATWAVLSTAGLKSIEIPDGKYAPSAILIAADNDASTARSENPGLEAARFAAQRLRLICPDVRIALPQVPEGKRLARDGAPGSLVSVDWLDVYNRLGRDRCAEAIRQGCEAAPDAQLKAPSEPWRTRPRGRIGVLGGADDRAEQHLRREWSGRSGEPTLRYHQGQWFGWDQRRYVRLEADWVRGQLRRWLRRCDVAGGWEQGAPTKFTPLSPNQKAVSDALDALRSLVICSGDLAGDRQPPYWIEREERQGSSGAWEPPIEGRAVVSFANGLLDAAAWTQGTRRLVNHDPRWFSETALDFPLPEEAVPGDDGQAWARAPVYKAFIERAFCEDMDDLRPGQISQVETLHEWVGYCMTPDNSLQRAMCIQGEPGTGKGTLLRLFERLQGGDRMIASTSLRQLGMRFGVQRLLGKLNAIMPDVTSASGAEAYFGAELLRMITGDDMVGVDRKTVSDLPGVRLPVRFTMTMNEVVRIPDETGAFMRRLIWLHTPAAVPADEREAGLVERIAPELPWIAVLALNGLARLRQRGQLLQPQAGEHLAQEFRMRSSSVLPFVSDCCELDDSAWVKKDDLFAAYKQWAEETSERPMSKSVFGRRLLNAGLGVRDHRAGSAAEGMRATGYRGIALKSELLNALPT